MKKMFKPPTAEAFRLFLRRNKITGSVAAQLCGFSDSRQIRKYTGGAKPYSVTFTVWWVLNAYVTLSDYDLNMLLAIADDMRKQDSVTPRHIYLAVVGYWRLDKEALDAVYASCIDSAKG